MVLLRLTEGGGVEGRDDQCIKLFEKLSPSETPITTNIYMPTNRGLKKRVTGIPPSNGIDAAASRRGEAKGREYRSGEALIEKPAQLANRSAYGSRQNDDIARIGTLVFKGKQHPGENKEESTCWKKDDSNSVSERVGKSDY